VCSGIECGVCFFACRGKKEWHGSQTRDPRPYIPRHEAKALSFFLCQSDEYLRSGIIHGALLSDCQT
jgi:hypothetical protein